MTNDERTQAAHLIIRGDGEDLMRLDPDPERFMKPIPSRAKVVAGLVVAIAMLAVTVPYVVWMVSNVVASEQGRSDLPELVTGLSIPAAIPLLGITILSWVFVLISSVGRSAKVRAREAYLALVAASPRPAVAVVRRCDYSSGETSSAYHVSVDVELGDGRPLHAAERRPVPVRSSAGVRYAYTAHQVPQFGDEVTVFSAPGRSPLTIVQANHSWSRMRPAAA